MTLVQGHSKPTSKHCVRISAETPQISYVLEECIKSWKGFTGNRYDESTCVDLFGNNSWYWLVSNDQLSPLRKHQNHYFRSTKNKHLSQRCSIGYGYSTLCGRVREEYTLATAHCQIQIKFYADREEYIRKSKPVAHDISN